MKWAYYLSPMSYGQNAIVIVEFLDKRWNTVSLFQSFSFYLFLLFWHLACSTKRTFVLIIFYILSFFQPNFDPRFPGSTAGKELLAARGMFTEEKWYWICVIALFGFSFFFNLCFVAALTYLKRKSLTVNITSCLSMITYYGF